ncbi:peptide deformylase [Streptococcus loxodontisalivarius]|uniref:Peptide deformylase n=1 Tax=Streptococcus loxodontisalivarius TaxID=1349415 RepID=A0ABS2PSI9_9STRE|nr:peptide deformylase [Streptococcus loxodontisalivarius]MBM7642893.1 peptide deformylase [Streptococcus loxodontisalivarius]
MIKPICKDTFFLAQTSQEATKDDLYLAQDLQDTLEANKEACVGMAANMIGIKKRVIIINMGLGNLVMFNPVVINKALPFDAEESCLSLTGSRKTVRYQRLEVSFYDIHWKKQTMLLTGFQAQICQHELDHLEGIVI